MVVALLVGGWFGIQHLRHGASKPEKKEILTVKAEIGDIKEIVDVVGEVASASVIEVKSEISGRIIQVHVVSGETVTKGLTREVWEETGLRVSVERLIGVYTSPHRIIEYADGKTSVLDKVVLSYDALRPPFHPYAYIVF